ALAVLVGVIISALVFAWDNAKRIRARKHIDATGAKVYEIYGPLFFGSVASFLDKFDIENDPDQVVIDFRESRVADMSAIDALNNSTARYSAADKQVVLKRLSADCRQKLKKAEGIIVITLAEDPTYKVVANR